MAKKKNETGVTENPPTGAASIAIGAEGSPAASSTTEANGATTISVPTADATTTANAPEQSAETVAGSTGPDDAPYGRDENGKPLAPYGLKKDGTPARKRGRGGDAPPDASAEPKEKKPRAKISDAAIEKAQDALSDAQADDGSFFSQSEDTKRQERAKRNATYWVEIAEMMIEAGEEPMRAAVASQLMRQHPEKAEQIKRMIAVIPSMRAVPTKWEGKETNVLRLNAEAAAYILAYFLPWKPSHPLLRSAFQIAYAYKAYSAGIRDAFDKAGIA